MLALIGAVLVAGFLGSLTDWLFMGVLFHDAYLRYPEVWWPDIAAGKDKRAVIYSSVIGFGMSVAVVALCWMAGVGGILGGLGVAVVAWIAGPLALTVMNALYIKLDRRIVLAHAVGYLARFALAGIAAGLALPH